MIELKEKMQEKEKVQVMQTEQSSKDKKLVYDTRNLNLWYGDNHALKDINLPI